MGTVRFEAERRALVAAGLDLARRGSVPGTSGNLSLRCGRRVLVTATGADLGRLTPRLVTVVDAADGQVLHGPPPTSELPLHLAVYAATDAVAVAHAHPAASVAAGLVCDELPAVHYATMLLGGPVRVAGYATFGSRELADAVVTALSGRGAALMRHHGSIACGASLRQACDRLALVEWLAEVYLRAAAVGAPRVLSAAELAAAGAELSRRSYPGG